MKKIVLNLTLMLAVAAAFVGCNNAAENAENTITDSTAVETSYTVDPAGSQVMWRGDMVKMYFHEGSVAVKEGTFTTKGGLLSTGSIVIDMNTITPLDSGYDNKDRTKEKLVGHLTSPDFFDIANNPTASFEIKSVNGAEATGILTIRGKSNEETIKNIVITETAEGSIVTGDLTFDRKKYDIAFDMTVKDMVLSNDIALKITLTGKK